MHLLQVGSLDDCDHSADVILALDLARWAKNSKIELDTAIAKIGELAGYMAVIGWEDPSLSILSAAPENLGFGLDETRASCPVSKSLEASLTRNFYRWRKIGQINNSVYYQAFKQRLEID